MLKSSFSIFNEFFKRRERGVIFGFNVLEGVIVFGNERLVVCG